MATIPVTELTNAQPKKEYKFSYVEPNVLYPAKIVSADIMPSKFGGQALTVVFEYLHESYKGCHIRAFYTYLDSNGRIGSDLITFVESLYQTDVLSEIDFDLLIGLECDILVVNRFGKTWQKVDGIQVAEKIRPEDENETEPVSN